MDGKRIYVDQTFTRFGYVATCVDRAALNAKNRSIQAKNRNKKSANDWNEKIEFHNQLLCRNSQSKRSWMCIEKITVLKQDK